MHRPTALLCLAALSASGLALAAPAVAAPAPAAAPASAAAAPDELVVGYVAGATPAAQQRARGKARAVRAERVVPARADRAEVERVSLPAGAHRRGRRPRPRGRPGRRLRRAELDLHPPGDLQRPVLHQRLALGHVRRRRPSPANRTAARPARRGRPATPARAASTSASSTRASSTPTPTSPPTSGPTRSTRSTASTTTATATSTTSTAGTSSTTTTRSTTATGSRRPRHPRRRHDRRQGRQRRRRGGRQLERHHHLGQVPRPQRRHHGQRDQGGRLLHRPEDAARPEHRRHRTTRGAAAAYSQALHDAIIRAAKAEHPVHRRGRQRRPTGRRQQRPRRQLPVELRHDRPSAGYDAVIAVAAIDKQRARWPRSPTTARRRSTSARRASASARRLPPTATAPTAAPRWRRRTSPAPRPCTRRRHPGATARADQGNAILEQRHADRVAHRQDGHGRPAERRAA